MGAKENLGIEKDL